MEKPFKGSPEVHVETEIYENKKVDLGLLEKSEVKDEALETLESTNSKEQSSPFQWSEDGVQLKARVKRYSTKKVYKHHVESVEVDFWDSDSDGSEKPDDTEA